MKRKHLISFLLALTMTVGCTMPRIVNAATDANGNSKAQTTTQEVNEETQAQSVAVDATVASTFSVSVPKTIQLDGAKKSASYKVTCSGDFPANKKVTVVPEANVTLFSVNKSEVIAAISQDKTEWLYDDNTEGKGTITADTISAGIWNGVFNFNITFENTECPENEHDWEYETKTEEKQVLVKDAYDEEKTEGVVICNQCNEEFSPNTYDEGEAGIDAAVEAWAIHSADSWDNGGNCDNYRVEERTIIIHHDAEYKTETVETQIGRTCTKCHKHEDLTTQ